MEKVHRASVVDTGSGIVAVASGANITPSGKSCRTKHVTYRVQDTVYCKRCNKSWDVTDKEVPVCESKARQKYLQFIKVKFK